MTAPSVTPTLAPLRLASFAGCPRVRHGITGRAAALWRDGDISYATGGDPARVFENRRAWADAIGIDIEAIVAVRQVHGAAVDSVDAESRGRGARSLDAATVPAADALLTVAPDTPLLLSFADCTPLLFHDPIQNVVGLAHAGWRGTVADIAGATVRAMIARYGSDPATIVAGIGPAIGRCCYVVDRPVVAAWRALGVSDADVLTEIAPVAERRQWRFDLARANRRLLERAGVRPERIEDTALCTAAMSSASHRTARSRARRGASRRSSA